MATINSSIIDQQKKTGIPGLHVELWQQENGLLRLIGSSSTSEDGRFQIGFNENDIQLPSDDTILAFFRVYDVKTSSTGIKLLDTSDRPIQLIMSDSEIEPMVTTGQYWLESRTHKVSGNLVKSDGRGLAGFEVSAFNKTKMGETFLSSAKTDEQGNYALYYSWPTITGSGNSVDLIVKVYDRSQVGTEPVISSPLIINALNHEIVNLLIGDAPYEGLDRYTRIHEAIGRINLENIGLREIAILSKEYQFLIEEVTDYVKAGQLATVEAIFPAELYFGWFQIGLAKRKTHLFGLSAATLCAGIDQAVDEHIIGKHFLEYKEELHEKLLTWRTNHFIDSQERPLHQASVGQLFKATQLTDSQIHQFLEQWQKFQGSVPDFWKEQQKIFGDKLIRDLELTMQLGVITRNHVPLIELLKSKNRISRLGDLATLQTEDWKDLIISNGLKVPDDITGRDLNDRIEIFATKLRTMTAVTVPTAVLAHSLKKDSEVESASFDYFFAQNPTFEFRDISVKKYLEAHPDALSGIANPEEFTEELNALQRVFHLTPLQDKYEAVNVLWKNQLHSTFAIKMAGEQTLQDLFKDQIGVGEKVYQMASYNQSVMQYMKMQIQDVSENHISVVPGAVDKMLLDGDADLETLFGDQGFCQCRHCSSFFSPAAYLVDLFLFLNKAKVDVTNPSADQDTVLERLFKRRPDLGNVELDCENSHTPMPYIDIINEVLENAIIVKNYVATPIKIFGKTFTLPIGEVPQTESDAQTLKAYPQHLNPAVYEILQTGNQGQGISFPWNLPFNLWMEEVRIYLEHLGVPRYELMQIIPGSLSSPSEIAIEYLKFLPEEKVILTNTDSSNTALQGYWGATFNELIKVPVFLKQSGFSYTALQELITMRFIQVTSTGIPIDVVFHPPSSCEISDATWENATHKTFARIHRVGRLNQRTDIDLTDLDRMLMSFDEEIDERFLITLAGILQTKNRLKRKVDFKEMLSWWSILDTYDYPEEPSIYAKNFLNPSLNKPFAQQFALNATADELAIPGTIIDLRDPDLNPDLLAMIQGATGLSVKELQTLVRSELPGGVITLTLAQLSYLYRVASFCHGMKWKISDFITFKALTGEEPLLSLGSNAITYPEDTLEFIKTISILEESGFNAPMLDYLLRHQYDLKASFAITNEDLFVLLKKIHDIINRAMQESYPVGITTKEIVEAKISRIIIFEEVPTAQAIIAGSSTLTIQEQKDFLDDYLIFFTNPLEAKNQLIDGGIVDPEGRYEYTLAALNQYLITTGVIQQISEALSLEPKLATSLLSNHLPHPSQTDQPALQVFLDPVFLETAPSYTWTAQQFPDQFAVLVRMHKVQLIVSTLGLDAESLTFIMTQGDIVGMSNLKDLPVEPELTVPMGYMTQFLALCKAVRLNRDTFDSFDSLFAILAAAQDTSVSQQNFFFRLQETTGWEDANIAFLTGNEGLNLTYPTDYQKISWLEVLDRTLRQIQRLGVTAQQAAGWTSANITKSQADSVRHVVKAKYGDEKWVAVTIPLRDRIRDVQRNALLNYVLHYIKKHDQTSFQNNDDIYEYFLMDMQMAPCTMTSRLVLAASTVQLFVQRIMMNLEPEMAFSKKYISEWQWRKYYRVWEANRKVFVWPENWIEPELRDDKTPFFRQLESELLQDELTVDTIERAYVNYLLRLDQTARLSICGSYEDEDKTLHVVARTHGFPATYYYRRWINKNSWTAWEKIELDIYNAEGVDPIPEKGILLPVVHNRRVYLFWPVFTKKHIGPSENEKTVIKVHKWVIDQIKEGKITGGKLDIWEIERDIEKLENGHQFYEVRIAWSVQHDGGWAAKKVTDPLKTPYFEKGFDKLHAYVFIPHHDNDQNLKINWYYLKSKTVYKFKSYFPFDACKGYLKIYINDGYTKLSSELYKKMSFMKYVGTGLQEMSIINSSNKKVKLLHKAPHNYQLSFSPQKSLYKIGLPFFYEDSEHTFFVIPPVPTYHLADKFSLATQQIASNTHALQEAVYETEPIDPEEVFQAGQVMYSEMLSSSEVQTSYYGANDVNQVIIRSKPMQVMSNSQDLSFDQMEADYGDLLIHPALGVLLLEGGYVFKTFYHPHTCLMLKHLNKYGIAGLLNPDSKQFEGSQLNYQLTPNHLDFLNFQKDYDPNQLEVKWTDSPKDIIDFDFDEAYATYNWEVFFHIPLFIATQLSRDQRFEDAQRWFHYIFNPTETEGAVPYRFWKIKPFYTYTVQQIKKDLEALMTGDASLKKQIQQWEQNPFNPHLIARFRKLAYMKSVVMKYLDNLIAWGDMLFGRDSTESINEATQIYVLVGQILGKLPIETEAKKRQAKTFNELAPDLTLLANAWVELELSLSGGNGAISGGDQTGGVLDDILYFCMPPNEKLLGYWDTVADRLFKIRHCMNIQGMVRELPLFQPPIDPALLVKAAAAGVDLSSTLNDLFAPLPYYRFLIIHQRALDLCRELKSLGAELLMALEKKDSEALALINANHEMALLEADKDVKALQVEEAKLAEVSLLEAKELINVRKEDYEQRDFISAGEATTFALTRAAGVTQSVGVGLQAGAGATHQAPDQFVGGLAGPMGGAISLTQITGGDKGGRGIEAAAKWLEFSSIILRDAADASATMSHYQRRQEDWDLQIALADQELKQIEKQLLEAQVRISITEKNKNNLDLRIEQSKQISDYLKNKYTHQELYNWMTGQIAATYFQTYQMAYDMAKQAEKAFRFELGIESSNYIQFGYWDNMKKGLLAGEKLYLDLKRLEVAFFEKNKRDYEITKHIPLSLIDPVALVQLKETGACEFNIPELLFDLDFPGQYFRRIKSVSISIPCIVGPYTSVSAKLTLLKNRIRKNGNSQTPYAYTGMDDSNFIHNLVGSQSIATSQAQGDNGMFELNFHDERYLPFEGAGAVGSWRLELPTEFRAFDYHSISEVILHMNYTAREGGDALKQIVNTHVNDTLNKWSDEMVSQGTGLVQVVSIKREFGSEWRRFMQVQLVEENAQAVEVYQVDLKIGDQHFPYFLRQRDLTLEEIQVVLKLKDEDDQNLVIGVPLKLFYGDGTNAVSVPPANTNGFQYGIAGIPSVSFPIQESPKGWWKLRLLVEDLPDVLKMESNTLGPLNGKKIEDLYWVFRYMVE